MKMETQHTVRTKISVYKDPKLSDFHGHNKYTPIQRAISTEGEMRAD